LAWEALPICVAHWAIACFARLSTRSVNWSRRGTAILRKARSAIDTRVSYAYGILAGVAGQEAIMRPSQDIGMIRRALVQRALAGYAGHPPQGEGESEDPQILRELLDEAHARIRALEKAIEHLKAVT
jgi:hypothetical protein